MNRGFLSDINIINVANFNGPLPFSITTPGLFYQLNYSLTSLPKSKTSPQ